MYCLEFHVSSAISSRPYFSCETRFIKPGLVDVNDPLTRFQKPDRFNRELLSLYSYFDGVGLGLQLLRLNPFQSELLS